MRTAMKILVAFAMVVGLLSLPTTGAAETYCLQEDDYCYCASTNQLKCPDGDGDERCLASVGTERDSLKGYYCGSPNDCAQFYAAIEQVAPLDFEGDSNPLGSSVC